MQNDRAKYQSFKITALAAALILSGCTGVNKEHFYSANWRSKPSVNLSEPSNYYETGKQYFSQGRYGLALDQFKEELKNHKSSLRALNGIAACYDKLGRYHVAMQYYDMALRIDPDSSLTLNNLGYSLMLQGKSNRAEKVLSMAENKNPDNAYVKKNREYLTAQKVHGPMQEMLEQPALAESMAANIADDAKKQTARVMASKVVESTKNEPANVKPAPEAAPTMLEMEKVVAPRINQEKHVSYDAPTSVSSNDSMSKQGGIESAGNMKNARVVDMEAVVIEEEIVNDGTVWEQPIFQQNIASLVERHELQSVDSVNGSQMIKELEEPQRVVAIKPSSVLLPVEESSYLTQVGVTSTEITQSQHTEKVAQLSKQASSMDLTKSASKLLSDKRIKTTKVEVDQPVKKKGETDFLFGPTQIGNTLWVISAKLNVDRKVGIKQMITALAMSNPEAFINGDIHRLKIGYMLWVPSNKEIVAINMPTNPIPIKKDLFAFSLEVSNGNGRRGMAKMVSIYLHEQGAKIARVSDAKSFAVEDSTIYYTPGYQKEALHLAEKLPVQAKIEENAKEADGVSVRLVIGKDLLHEESVIRRSLMSRNHV